MKIDYDPDADAMNIKLRQGNIDRTIKIDENVLMDLDKSGEIINIEILFVKERNPGILKGLKIGNPVSA